MSYSTELAIHYAKDKEQIPLSEHNKFAHAIVNGEAGALHAYGDWLEENGFPETAEAIATQLHTKEPSEVAFGDKIDYGHHVYPDKVAIQTLPKIDAIGVPWDSHYATRNPTDKEKTHRIVKLHIPTKTNKLNFLIKKPTHVEIDLGSLPIAQVKTLLREHKDAAHSKGQLESLDITHPDE